jgi:hypothetical protein
VINVFPITIAAWPRNSREIVRITLDRFKNSYTIGIRIWFRDANGIPKPGPKGLTLAVKHLPKLTYGLGDALERARVYGLVSPAAKTTNRGVTERECRYRGRHPNGGANA